MIAVYAEQLTPRLQYITRVLADNWQMPCRLLSDHAEFAVLDNCVKINYSSKKIAAKEIQIEPFGLLFQQSVEAVPVLVEKQEETAVFFRPSNGQRFDVLSAAFYLLSRYEEYLPHSKDAYGRYAHTNSLAFKNGFLDVPLVNTWFDKLKQEAKLLFPLIQFRENSFRFLPTYDIDIAYSYKGKGWLRNTGGLLKDILQFRFRQVSERLRVLSGKQEDPFDTFAFLDALHANSGLQPLYFWLMAGKKSVYDKNLLPYSPQMKTLLQEHAKSYNLGIHPSWQSYLDPSLVSREHETLEQVTGQPVWKSRQHYIRLSLPESYRLLLSLGIREDYSMGYGSINGFRASYCLPYPWYDLEKETVTDLMLYPFCYMDANAFFEQKYPANAAAAELRHYYAVTQQVNGLFITIFHNNFLTATEPFTGYHNMYKDFIRELAV